MGFELVKSKIEAPKARPTWKLMRLDPLLKHFFYSYYTLTSSKIAGVYLGGTRFTAFGALSFPLAGRTFTYFPVL